VRLRHWIAANAKSATSEPVAGGVRKAFEALWQTISGDTYRPESHYMRGPGPKSHRENETRDS
jgi:hypothetical protein